MPALDEKKLQRTLEEIFWGDYRIDAQMVKEKMAQNDEAFLRFLAGRIVAHSQSPTCRLLSLFSPARAVELLTSIRTIGHAERRRTLALALISQTPWEEEPQWLRSPTF